MTVQFGVTIQTDLVTKRTFSRIAREGRRGLMERHHKRVIPRHFRPGAASRYGYRRRTGSYVRRARRLNPNWRPLVLTGQLRRIMTDTGNPNHRITATQKRGRLKLSAKSHPFMRRGGNPWRGRRGTGNGRLSDRIREELETVTDAEVQESAEWLRDRIVREMKKPKNRARRRRGSNTFRA